MSLAQIKLVSGRGVYVPGDDIDTDQIIPARFLMCVTFDALGGQLFYYARFNADKTSKGHPLDDPRFAGARVLIAGANFGCGSSREHAPQSIHKAGFRAVVAESFAEIFFGNSTTLGLPCLSLSRVDLAALAALVQAAPETEIEVDVARLEVRAGGKTWQASLKPSARDALLRGEWDPIAQLLEGKAQADETAKRLPYLNW
jgi:3-isopropylmalate/(R)-2-methylmalate dehydratase small subunit